MKIPSKNVYWRDIPADATVTLRNCMYLVDLADGPAVAYWEGREAREAQRSLDRRAVRAYD